MIATCLHALRLVLRQLNGTPNQAVMLFVRFKQRNHRIGYIRALATAFHSACACACRVSVAFTSTPWAIAFTSTPWAIAFTSTPWAIAFTSTPWAIVAQLTVAFRF